MHDKLWETEEFEDLVARGLIALYEKGMYKECYKVPPFIRPSDKDIQQIRNMGAYFPPNDRCINAHEIDLINDGLPKEACWGYNPTEEYNGKRKKDLIDDEYFRLGYLRLIDKAPPGVLNMQGYKYFGNQKIYKLLNFSATQTHGIHIMKSYVSIDENGQVYDTFARRQDGKLIILAHGSMDMDEGDSIISDIGWTTAIVGFYQDRRYLWNVTANEGIAKAMFGIHQEQVKSLFYAREMPMTATGRKRPILHWVNAHQRRIKNGIDIDIEKHLRGTNEFIYNGTKFIITRPIK